MTTNDIKFLTDEEALTLQAINGLRDAADHHIVDVSEGQLYVFAQAAVTLFKEKYEGVLSLSLMDGLPERVLPVSTRPPATLEALFHDEVEEVKRLLAPGTRQRLNARAKLRGMAILEGAVTGENSQPSPAELDKLCTRVKKGADWSSLFPGVASIEFNTSGDGFQMGLRIVKKEGVPITIVQEGSPSGAVVAIKRVNELDYYSLGLRDLSKKMKMTQPKTLAAIMSLVCKMMHTSLSRSQSGGSTINGARQKHSIASRRMFRAWIWMLFGRSIGRARKVGARPAAYALNLLRQRVHPTDHTPPPP